MQLFTHVILIIIRNMLPSIERPFGKEDREAIIQCCLFLDSSSLKRAWLRARQRASNCCSLGNWERGDTMRFLHNVGIDSYEYVSNPKAICPDHSHMVLIANVGHSKELTGDKQRVG